MVREHNSPGGTKQRAAEHLSTKFPDMGLIESFDFNPGNVPSEPALQRLHGVDLLEVLISHYSPHHVIDSESVKQELIIFNGVIAANKEFQCMSN